MQQPNKILDIVADGIILFSVSTALVIGANVIFSSLKGKTPKDNPLVAAISAGEIRDVKKAINNERTTDALAVDEHGRSALMWAAYVNLSAPEPPDSETKELLDAFARCGVHFDKPRENLNKQREREFKRVVGNWRDYSPIARPENPPEASADAVRKLAKLLAKQDIKVGNPLTEADDLRSDITTMLLDNGAKINATDNDGWTALMWASWSNLPKTARVLLERGCPVNAADRQGNTALTIAAQRGNAAIVRVLLENGANANARTKNNQTALDLANEAKTDNPKARKNYQATVRALGGH